MNLEGVTKEIKFLYKIVINLCTTVCKLGKCFKRICIY